MIYSSLFGTGNPFATSTAPVVSSMPSFTSQPAVSTPAAAAAAFGASSPAFVSSTSPPKFHPCNGCVPTPQFFRHNGAGPFAESTGNAFATSTTPSQSAFSTPAAAAASGQPPSSNPRIIFDSKSGIWSLEIPPTLGSWKCSTSVTPAASFGASSTPSFTFDSCSPNATPAAAAATFGVSSTSKSNPSICFDSKSSTWSLEIPPSIGSWKCSCSLIPAASFGSLSTPSFSFDSNPGLAFFRQPSPPSPATPPPFGPSKLQEEATRVATNPFAESKFGRNESQSLFAAKNGGSKAVAYRATNESNYNGTEIAKVQSISAMFVYDNKSHEELRWEDYQLGQKGTPNPTTNNSPPPTTTTNLAPAKFIFPQPDEPHGEKRTQSPFSSLFATPFFSSQPQPQPIEEKRAQINPFRSAPFDKPEERRSFSVFSQTAQPQLQSSIPLFGNVEPIFGKGCASLFSDNEEKPRSFSLSSGSSLFSVSDTNEEKLRRINLSFGFGSPKADS